MSHARPSALVREVQAELQTAALSNPSARFADVMDWAQEPESLRSALNLVRSRRGADTAGPDGIKPTSITHDDKFVLELQVRMVSGHYNRGGTRAASIAKPTGGTRTIYIQNAVDRVADTAVGLFMRPITDADLPDCLYGYREGRGTLQALIAFGYLLSRSRPDSILLKLDLSGCFGSLKWAKLRHSLRRRFNDDHLFPFVRGLLAQSGGVPQGSPLSPTLADCHLQPLAKELEAHGQAVMNGDDIVAICANYNEAKLLHARLTHVASTLGVSFAVQKTKIARAIEGTTFLGYHFALVDGQLRVQAAPTALQKLEVRLTRLANKLRHAKARDLIEGVNTTLRGWGEYFRFDARALAASYHIAHGVVLAWLEKRFPWRIIRRYYVGGGSLRDGDAVLLDPIGLFQDFPVANLASGRSGPASLPIEATSNHRLDATHISRPGTATPSCSPGVQLLY